MTVPQGRGYAPLVTLMILPIVFDDQVLGVIEAGSFSRFTRVHQDFLEQLMETIGGSVNSIIANSRTAALLTEAPPLAPEVHARTRALHPPPDVPQPSKAD